MAMIARALWLRATHRHGYIQPCAGRSWPECFTVVEGKLTLWYNDPHGSTHIVRQE